MPTPTRHPIAPGVGESFPEVLCGGLSSNERADLVSCFVGAFLSPEEEGERESDEREGPRAEEAERRANDGGRAKVRKRSLRNHVRVRGSPRIVHRPQDRDCAPRSRIPSQESNALPGHEHSPRRLPSTSVVTALGNIYHNTSSPRMVLMNANAPPGVLVPANRPTDTQLHKSYSTSVSQNNSNELQSVEAQRSRRAVAPAASSDSNSNSAVRSGPNLISKRARGTAASTDQEKPTTNYIDSIEQKLGGGKRAAGEVSAGGGGGSGARPVVMNRNDREEFVEGVSKTK